MKRIGGGRPRWRRRAAALALIGGLAGWIAAYMVWIAAYTLLLRMLQMVSRIHGPASANFDQVVAWVARDARLGFDLILAALVYGGLCGAALGLVIWSVWFQMSHSRLRPLRPPYE